MPTIYDNNFGGEPQASDYHDGEAMYDTIDNNPQQPDFSEPFTVLNARDVDDGGEVLGSDA
jgi:hypothetical protein